MVRGSCLCGGVRFECDGVPLMHNCHCSKCRKAHGSAFRTGAAVPVERFRASDPAIGVEGWLVRVGPFGVALPPQLRRGEA